MLPVVYDGYTMINTGNVQNYDTLVFFPPKKIALSMLKRPKFRLHKVDKKVCQNIGQSTAFIFNIERATFLTTTPVAVVRFKTECVVILDIAGITYTMMNIR